MNFRPQQLTRRMTQFASLLDRLQQMWQARTKDPECYVVLNEFPLQSIPAEVSFAESAPASTCTPPRPHRGGDDWSRFAQMAFHGDWFYLELPNMTLSPAGGLRLIQERPGFFYLRDRPNSPSSFGADHCTRLVQELNPVHKCYRAGDETVAATDLAYVWFTLWKVPVDWIFQIRMDYFAATSAENFTLA